jgi:hypothetical protein
MMRLSCNAPLLSIIDKFVRPHRVADEVFSIENSNGGSDMINTKDFVSNSVRTHELINDGKKRSVAT